MFGGLAALAAAAVSAWTPVFGTPATVATVAPDGYLARISVADVTGDGIPDIVGVRDTNAGEAHPIVVLAGNGKGGFRNVTAQVFSGQVTQTVLAERLLFADFNRDGHADIFIADTGADGEPFAGAPNELILSAPEGKLVDASGKRFPTRSRPRCQTSAMGRATPPPPSPTSTETAGTTSCSAERITPLPARCS